MAINFSSIAALFPEALSLIQKDFPEIAAGLTGFSVGSTLAGSSPLGLVKKYTRGKHRRSSRSTGYRRRSRHSYRRSMTRRSHHSRYRSAAWMRHIRGMRKR